MTHLDTMMKNPNSSLLGFVGAAGVGFVMQLVLHLSLGGQPLMALAVVLCYSFIIAIIEFTCRNSDCKVACQLNEFWFTLEAIVRKKLNLEQ